MMRWIAICCAPLLACGEPRGYEPPQDGAASSGPSGALCPAEDPPNYDEFASDFFAAYCTRCHAADQTGSERNGAPPDRNFDSLENLQRNDPDVIDRVAGAGPEHTNTFMPPSDPRPSSAERERLAEWLACGMP